MHVTTKGQVTIPVAIRQRHGITPNSEIEFKEENDRIFIVKKRSTRVNTFKKFRGIATVKLSTDEIMKLTRQD